MLGHAGEHCAELGALLCREVFGELAVLLAGELAELGHQFLALGGQVEGVQAAVGVVALARDIAADLEVVNEGDHAAGQQIESVGELLLR